jgi:hypothetical protein
MMNILDALTQASGLIAFACIVFALGFFFGEKSARRRLIRLLNSLPEDEVCCSSKTGGAA